MWPMDFLFWISFLIRIDLMCSLIENSSKDGWEKWLGFSFVNVGIMFEPCKTIPICVINYMCDPLCVIVDRRFSVAYSDKWFVREWSDPNTYDVWVAISTLYHAHVIAANQWKIEEKGNPMYINLERCFSGNNAFVRVTWWGSFREVDPSVAPVRL